MSAVRFSVTLLLLALAGGCSEPPEATKEVLPAGRVQGESGLDVLLITIDTLRADALGSYGNSTAATPWMDRLATEGVRFTSARAHNVVTLPSHATILSGLLPQEHGVRDNSGFRFPSAQKTLTTILAERGYRTAAFVSAFPLDSRFGLDRGFDLYEDSFVDAGRRPAFLEQERPASETVALAARWLAAADSRPSFAWVHLYEPHFPYDPPPPFDRRFSDDPYLGDVAAADAALEPLLAPILEAGDSSNALVVLTSDHGESLGDHGEATHGIFAYESTLRVPLILHQPRLLSPRVVAAPARLVDLLPTILDLLAAPKPSDLTGSSLAAVASGAPPEAEVPTYFEALSGQLNRDWAPLFGLVQGGWKYIHLPIPELYDLAADPRERRNLASAEQERARELRSILAALRSSDPGAEPTTEDAETRRRLESLGYLSGGTASKTTYTEEDDPKRLIVLDAELQEITSLYVAGELEAARARCRELLARRPDMRVTLMTLAQIERDLGRIEEAVEAMRRAFELQPGDPATLALLASYLTQAGRPAEAAELTEAHLGRDQPDIDVLFVRSIALARLDRSSEAFVLLERTRELDPDNPMIPVYVGTLHLMAGRQAQARTSFDEALALNPGTVRAHTSLAVMASEEGRIDDALEHWRRATALDRREFAKLLVIAGRMWASGQEGAARPLLEHFAAAAPRNLFGPDIDRVRRLLTAPGDRRPEK
jgi:arylsulfatase A-like enzyme/Tfp pilus assembly protein PilF